jgi:hypothetical protein
MILAVRAIVVCTEKNISEKFLLVFKLVHASQFLVNTNKTSALQGKETYKTPEIC